MYPGNCDCCSFTCIAVQLEETVFVIFSLFSFSLEKLRELSKHLPVTAGEVDEYESSYSTVKDEAAKSLKGMIDNYDAHKSLDQGLTHVEQSLADLEDNLQALSDEKADTEELSKTLEVRGFVIHAIEV